MTSPGANQIIEAELRSRLCAVERVLDADLLVYQGPMEDDTPTVLKGALESLDDKREHLAVLLETPGGYIEAVERLVNIFRHHYKIISYIVTSVAMSAGTVLVMSGDHIYMDYSATLGPIDPQVPRIDRPVMVPALGYLEQYERLVEKSRQGTLTTVETMYLLQNFDAAELYQFEQARELSNALLQEWLATYKFKDWSVTESRKRRVTDAMKRRRAKEIADALNDPSRWHSHARGISMDVIRRDLNLKVNDIADTPDLQKALQDYERLFYDYNAKLGHNYWAANWRGGYHGH